MENRLERLTRKEQAASRIAERALGAKADPWDVEGRQGAVDARLTLPDGRIAAFEVTAHAAASCKPTHCWGGTTNEWPSPGQWWWSIQIGSVKGAAAPARHLRGRRPSLRSACVTRSEDLRRLLLAPDPDVDWLAMEALSSMQGHPDVPAKDGAKIRHTSVVAREGGGGVDHALAGLRKALLEALQEPNLARHLNKVANAGCDERLLFIIIRLSALPYAVLDGLAFGDRLPPNRRRCPQR